MSEYYENSNKVQTKPQMFGEHKIQDILSKTFGKFFMGLLLLMSVAALTYFFFKDEFVTVLQSNNTVALKSGTNIILMGALVIYMIVVIAQIVLWIRIKKSSYHTIMVWYVLYALSSGVMFGTVSIIYSYYYGPGIILIALGSTTAVFGGAWIMGSIVKANLQKFWPYILVSMLIITVVELVLYLTGSYTDTLDLVISPIMILLSVFWIMWKVQTLKVLDTISESTTLNKISLLFAWSFLTDYMAILYRMLRILAAARR